MKEIGVVSSASGKYAKVKMERRQGCKNCNLCGFGKNDKTVNITVLNDIGAKIGQKVEVEFSAVEVTKAVGVIYIVPVVLAGIGILVTSLLKQSELVQLIVAFAMLSLSVLFIYLFEKAFKNKGSLPQIAGICKESEKEDENDRL